MNVGDIVVLERPDPDGLAEHFRDTSYPVYGVVARAREGSCRCEMFIRSDSDIEDGIFVGWHIPTRFLTLLE